LFLGKNRKTKKIKAKKVETGNVATWEKSYLYSMQLILLFS